MPIKNLISQVPRAGSDAAGTHTTWHCHDRSASWPHDGKPTLRAESAQLVSDYSETFEHLDVAIRDGGLDFLRALPKSAPYGRALFGVSDTHFLVGYD